MAYYSSHHRIAARLFYSSFDFLLLFTHLINTVELPKYTFVMFLYTTFLCLLD